MKAAMMLVGVAAIAAITLAQEPGPRAVSEAGTQAKDTDAYLRYTHATIRGPIPDLLDVAIPAELEDQAMARLGYVNVTAGPFHADSTGTRDSSQAIQAAVTFARDHQMACFFPPGTYLLSETLSCTQQLYRRSNGKVFGGNRFPNMLVGSRSGTRRPRLVLAPHAPGFDDPAHPKIFIHFWARGYANPTNGFLENTGPDQEQPNISMNQMLVNLDLTIGEGNPGAIALRHQAAEGSAIEECTIDATHGLTGIQGGIGSGGGSTAVTVIGGRVGLDFTGYMSGTQPTPVITGFTLIGQTEAAIRSTSRQTLVAAGLRITADRCEGPLIQVGSNLQANHGELTLVDSVIEFQGDTLKRDQRVAVQSDRGVYLQDVYVKGATQVVHDPEGKASLAGNPSGWLHVRQHAAASTPRPNQGNTYRYPVYVDGKAVDRVSQIAVDEAPPEDLAARHLWTQPFAGFETAGAVNVQDSPWNARGDGRSDDTDAIQRAVDASPIVFLPRGCYVLTRTVHLRPDTTMIGVGQSISLLVAGPGGAFDDKANPAPLIRTADAADAATTLAMLGLYTPSTVVGARAIDWRCGARSVFRGVEIKGRMAGSPASVVISGQGGGKFYNYRDSAARLLVDGAQGTLRFYQFSVQQVTSELRGARDARFYGTKYEGNDPMLRIVDCDRVDLYGHGGNGKGRPEAALFVIEGTRHFLLANGVDGPTRIGSKSLSHRDGSTDPRLWHFLIDHLPDGTQWKLPPLERPVLYQRGQPHEGER